MYIPTNIYKIFINVFGHTNNYNTIITKEYDIDYKFHIPSIEWKTAIDSNYPNYYIQQVIGSDITYTHEMILFENIVYKTKRGDNLHAAVVTFIVKVTNVPVSSGYQFKTLTEMNDRSKCIIEDHQYNGINYLTGNNPIVKKRSPKSVFSTRFDGTIELSFIHPFCGKQHIPLVGIQNANVIERDEIHQLLQDIWRRYYTNKWSLQIAAIEPKYVIINNIGGMYIELLQREIIDALKKKHNRLIDTSKLQIDDNSVSGYKLCIYDLGFKNYDGFCPSFELTSI